MGVTPAQQGAGLGRRLLLESLYAMRSLGYVYAVIGNVEEALGFYVKTVGASPIEDSRPGAYEFDLKRSEQL
jgi:GNAT superfamily N-acetyltransferase